MKEEGSLKFKFESCPPILGGIMKVKRANRLMSIYNYWWNMGDTSKKSRYFINDWYLGQIFSLYTCNYGFIYLQAVLFTCMHSVICYVWTNKQNKNNYDRTVKGSNMVKYLIPGNTGILVQIIMTFNNHYLLFGLWLCNQQNSSKKVTEQTFLFHLQSQYFSHLCNNR